MLWEILVPVRYNNGKKIKRKTHRKWDAKVRAISKGLTILKPAKGSWISPGGVLFMEEMIPVRIACTRKQIDQISDITAKHYDQKAVMITMLSTSVRIKHY